MGKGRGEETKKAYFTMFMSELFGTAIMMFMGCMGCITELDGIPRPPHHMYTLSFGLVILLVIQSFVHISGAHVNPSVTIAAVLCKHLTPTMGLVYISAQFIGSTLGMALLKIVIPRNYTGSDFCLNLPNKEMTIVQALALEIICTALLIIVIHAVWDKRNSDKMDSLPLKFGFIIAAFGAVAGPFGLSMNTARTFGPAVLEGNYTNQWIYWLGPVMGTIMGWGIYNFLFELKDDEAKNSEEICILEGVVPNKEEIQKASSR